MNHNPPTAPLVYMAEPMDLAAGPSHSGAVIARELADCGVTVFRPATTWSGGQHNPALVERTNRDMLARADALVVIGHTGTPSIGTWMEVEQARSRQIHTVVRWSADQPKSVSLQAAGVLWAEHNAEAVALASDLAFVHHKRTNRPNTDLLVVLSDHDGQTDAAPEQAYPDDAGYDLVTSEDTVIPANGFADVPTTVVGIRPPDGTWGLIIGRSSAMRRRNLRVLLGVIDFGWRAQLLVGVENATNGPITVGRGERIAQYILIPTVPAHLVPVGQDALPYHPRGGRGFGSSGGHGTPGVESAA